MSCALCNSINNPPTRSDWLIDHIAYINSSKYVFGGILRPTPGYWPLASQSSQVGQVSGGMLLPQKAKLAEAHCLVRAVQFS